MGSFHNRNMEIPLWPTSFPREVGIRLGQIFFIVFKSFSLLCLLSHLNPNWCKVIGLPCLSSAAQRSLARASHHCQDAVFLSTAHPLLWFFVETPPNFYQFSFSHILNSLSMLESSSDLQPACISPSFPELHVRGTKNGTGRS